MRRLTSATLGAALALAAAPAGAASTALTVYSGELARVAVTRTDKLPAGPSTLTLDPVAAGILPDSVSARGDGLRALGHSVSTWPITRRALLRANLGERIRVIRPDPEGRGRVTRVGTLLALEDGTPIVRVNNRVVHDPRGELAFPGLPDDAAAPPRAEVRVRADTAGERRVTLSYLTRGISWSPTHHARWDRQAGTLTLRTTAAVTNTLDHSVPADSVRLAAGEVSRVRNDEPRPQARGLAAADAGGSEQRAPERAGLTVYDLDRGLDLDAGATRHLALVPAQSMDVSARHRITGLATARPRPRRERTRAELRLRVADTRAAGLTRDLPAGVVRVTAGELYRGAQRIPATPLGTPLTLDLGTAARVTATTRAVDASRKPDEARTLTRAVTVRNAREHPVTAHIVGDFPDVWTIDDESHPHTRRDARTPVWAVDVAAGGESELRYTVRVPTR